MLPVVELILYITSVAARYEGKSVRVDSNRSENSEPLKPSLSTQTSMHSDTQRYASMFPVTRKTSG
jgi:hypothetical protein